MTIKRPPEIERKTRGIFEIMSKAAWAEAYRDLYIQVFGAEAALPDAWARDAQRRTEILTGYRKADLPAQRAEKALGMDGTL